jgi:hypothetical protein
MNAAMIECTSACGRPVIGTITDAAGAKVRVCKGHCFAMGPHACMGFVFALDSSIRKGDLGCEVAIPGYELVS